MAAGEGRSRGLPHAARPASGKSLTPSASAIEPEEGPALGVNPPPRKETGRGAVSRSACGEASGISARSSMLDLALGFYSLFADQRPQLPLQPEQFFAGMDVPPLGARQRASDHLPEAARP